MTRWGIRIVLMAFATALAAGPAWARVGVTSVTNGDPLGQPPAEPERVLRVGIDVQANERITTRADDRAHVVFLDGTALTIGPNSALVIDKYVYDPDRKAGDIALNVTRGTFRFVGGAISKNNEVTIKTPSATIGIRGGIVSFSVSDSGATTANFLYGTSMRVTALGATQTATRNGSEITVPPGGQPAPPTLPPLGGAIGTRSFERNLTGMVQAVPAVQSQATSQTSGPSPGPGPGPGPGTGPGRTTTAPSPTIQPGRTAIAAAIDSSSLDKSNSLLGPQLALTKGIRSDDKDDKPGKGGDKGASVSSLRLGKVATRAINVQNTEFNISNQTKAEAANSAFGKAGGNGKAFGVTNSNNGGNGNNGNNGRGGKGKGRN
jgi:hypothetical protein